MQTTLTSNGPDHAVWLPVGNERPAFTPAEVVTHIAQVRRPLHIVREGSNGRIGTALAGEVRYGTKGQGYLLHGTLPPLYPEWLGDRSFLEVHQVRFPYVAGEMANGITSTQMVVAMAKAQMLGFFGAGGLPPGQVERAIDEITAAVGGQGQGFAWGSNLIHSPHEPTLEAAVADLYIRKGVRRVSASAYMRLTPSIVRVAYAGVGVDAQGRITRLNHVFAKISRPEVAEQFMSPAPEKMLRALVEQGLLTQAEAKIAAQLPVAEDITVEADSGGHTDNRPLGSLFPTILLLRDQLTAKYRYSRPIRVGAAGGLGTPSAVAAAFALGAAYVVTGSINQSAVESGLSDAGKDMLSQAGVADVAMAPSPDMFELGVKVQVLKRGTMFAARAGQLYALYGAYPSWDAVPPDKRQRVEQEIFQKTFEEVWAETERFWSQRGPHEIDKARRDAHHKMSLAFRWYLGLASHWAILGEPGRAFDYQIWCGPAQGAFNAWVQGTFLEDRRHRTVVQIARNMLEGAAVTTRAQQVRSYGVAIPQVAFDFRPTPLG